MRHLPVLSDDSTSQSLWSLAGHDVRLSSWLVFSFILFRKATFFLHTTSESPLRLSGLDSYGGWDEVALHLTS